MERINKEMGVLPLAFEATLKPLNNKVMYQIKNKILISPNPITNSKLEVDTCSKISV